MKRIHAAAFAAALVAAMPVRAQQASARTDVLTLTSEDGKTAQTYKVVRTYKHPSGGTATEVRDEKTGETMTVVENAQPDDVKASFKMEPFVSAKQTEPTKAADTAKSVDPILSPKAYAAPKVQQELGVETQYTRPPVPATRRWFNWMRPAQDAKPAPMPATQGRMPAGQGEMMAVYSPDPVIRLIGSMTDDLLPSMREVSAETLVRTGKNRPEVVQAMVRSAKTDLAPSVRACCCHCLVEMKVQTPECISALKGLENDPEPQVRTAAAAARATLEQP
jgi:hypothetical protein